MRIFENIDCIEGMQKYKDILKGRKTLAIVDPPYEIADNPSRHGGSGKLKSRTLNMNAKKFNEWDKKPKQEYFNELRIVSQNQIIWGGNYFNLPATRGIIVWDKMQPWENFSQVELAWTSFNKPASLFKYDNRTGDKIHPTQKPIKLYKWLLENYAKGHDLILDTHVGSASSLIACEEFGIDYIGFELDTDYYNSAKERLEKARFIRENKKADECFINDLALFSNGENKK